LSRQTVVAIILLEKNLFYDGLSGMTGASELGDKLNCFSINELRRKT